MIFPVFLHIEATPNPNEMVAHKYYLSQAAKIVKQHGGVPVATYDIEHAFDDDKCPAIIAVISFPHREVIANFFNDSAYKALVPLRDKGFSRIRFYQTSE